MALSREANSKDPDALYAAIIEAHAGLSDADSAALNARLVLLLANHIGEESRAARGARRGAQVDRQKRLIGPGPIPIVVAVGWIDPRCSRSRFVLGHRFARPNPVRNP